MELLIKESWYYPQGDDALSSVSTGLPCLKSVKGVPDGLHISLRRVPSDRHWPN